MDKNRYFGFPSVSHRSFIGGRCLRLRNFGGVIQVSQANILERTSWIENRGSNILDMNRGSNILERSFWIERTSWIENHGSNILDRESWIEHLGSIFKINIDY